VALSDTSVSLAVGPKLAMSGLELEGYLTGIIVAPVLIQPSRWMARLWDDESVSDDATQVQAALGAVGMFNTLSNRIERSLRRLSRIRLVDQRLAIGFAAGTDSQVQGMAGKSPLSATEEQQAALTVLAGSCDRGEADRARAVLLTLASWTSARIAEAFGVRQDTVRLWRSDFTSDGVEALKASVAPGPAPVKSEAALRVITPLLEEPVTDRRNWTIPRLRAEIEAREGVCISRSQLSKALRKKVPLAATATHAEGTPDRRGGRTGWPASATAQTTG
jgi:transposase